MKPHPMASRAFFEGSGARKADSPYKSYPICGIVWTRIKGLDDMGKS